MKVYEKYTNYLLKGEWHIHTSWTDGNNTIFDYCEKAIQEGIPLVAFTEHVSKSPDYDFRLFLNEIEKAIYEIKNGRRGSYASLGDTEEEFLQNLSSLGMHLDDVCRGAIHEMNVDYDD